MSDEWPEPFGIDCPECGDVCYGSHGNLMGDGDKLVCDGCGRGWYVSVEEDGEAWINDEQEPDAPEGAPKT
jgi:hypothetical protein